MCAAFERAVEPLHSALSSFRRLNSSFPHPPRHSREGGNPRANIPRKNANGDTTTYVHTATPLRRSGPPFVIPAKAVHLKTLYIQHRYSGEGRNPEGREEGNVVRSKTSRGEGLVPRWGGGGAWQNAPCRFAVPNNNSSFSYLGVPAPAGMNDCYESMSRTPIRQ